MKHLSLIVAFSAITYVASAQSVSPRKDSSQSKPSVSKLEIANPIKIDLKDVANNVGQYVEVKGTVYGHKAFERFMLLNVGAAYPNQVLTILVNGKAFETFKAVAVDTKVVSVKGLITNYKGKPEIIVSTTKDIKLVD